MIEGNDMVIKDEKIITFSDLIAAAFSSSKKTALTETIVQRWSRVQQAQPEKSVWRLAELSESLLIDSSVIDLILSKAGLQCEEGTLTMEQLDFLMRKVKEIA